MPRKLTTEEFIEKAREVHGDKYDYSKTVYESANKKIVVSCRKHGDFTIRASSHSTMGTGCKKCQYDQRKVGSELFIKKSKEIHGDKYTYEKVDYKNNKEHVTVTCKLHGDFKIRPSNHINHGQGCNECGQISVACSLRGNLRDFVVRAEEVHGDRYDYSVSEYNGINTKTAITCPLHGIFTMTPKHHLNGSGCNQCAINDRGWGLRGYYGTLEQSNLYILKINNSFIKVGLAKEIHKRMVKINKDSGYSVEKLYSISGPAYKLWLLEQTILRLSDLKQYTPQVSFAGQSECLEVEELDEVMGIVKEWKKFNKEE